MGVKQNIAKRVLNPLVQWTLLLAIGLSIGFPLMAQKGDEPLIDVNFKKESNMEITYVITDSRIPGYLDINIRAVMRDTIVDYEFLENNLSITEIVHGEEYDLDVQKVAPQVFDMVTVIVDISSSMWRNNKAGGTYVDSAKIICDSIISRIEAPYMLNLYTFDEQLYRVTPEGMRNAKRPVEARYTHLYESVDAAIGRMSESKGKKLLVIIGDGENDHNRRKPVKITREDLLEKIKNLDESWSILPVAIGPKIYGQNLRQIVASTPSRNDSIVRGWPGPGVWDEITTFKEWEWTHTILMKSVFHPHIGEKREVIVSMGDNGSMGRDSTMYRVGGLYKPWNEQTNWQLIYFLGGLLCFLTLILFAFIVPWRRWKDFRKKYVKEYWEVKEEGVQRYDPLTKFPFRDEDFVVVRCDHMQSIETWQYEGRRAGKDASNRKRKGQCIYYPHKCESGHGPSGISDFLQQKGFYKYLMWLFFGVVGGYVGWALWATWESAKNLSFKAWMAGVAEREDIREWAQIAPEATQEDATRLITEQFLGPWFYQTIMGFLVGFCITVAIALAMELSQSKGGFRGWGILKLIFRLLARGLAAGLLGALIFFGFGMGQYFLSPSAPYLLGLLSLLLLGVAIGRALTTGTGIRNVRGALAGLAGGFAAFHIYYLPMLLTNYKGYEGPKMLSFMVMGGLLGYILSRSAPALEAAELDIFTGRKRYGTGYVTDLLRKNEEVTIGRGPTSTIRLKLRYTPQHYAPADITQTFAKLTLRNEVVYLIPQVFTEVNGDPIAPNEKVPLIDGDKITFNHTSPSHLWYREFRTGPHPKRRRRLGRERKKKKALTSADNPA